MKTSLISFSICVLLAGAASVFLFVGASDSNKDSVPTADFFAPMNFGELSSYFAGVANERGGGAAFALLKEATLPPNTDLHLLGHVIGDELYKQEGVDGMAHCTHDFRNACSHSIVIGALLEYGEGVVPLVRDACQKAPGGSGAYTMCFHGFGHGVLAFNEYDFADTVSFCRLTGTDENNHREYQECVGGAVMEILSGGGHDRQLWSQKRQEYLSPEDPLGLCQQSFMTDDLQPMCYTYLTPYLFEVAGADMGRPTAEDFGKAFRYCDAIPGQEEENRRACFGGFGKEFTVLAQDRDIRRMETMTDAQLIQVYEWCALASKDEALGACITDAVYSLHWGGENDVSLPLRFCAAMSEGYGKDVCYEEVTNSVEYYITNEEVRSEYCALLPEERRPACRETLTP